MKKNKNKVLITGHSGFVGSWLFYYLKKKKYDVYGISLAPKNKSELFYKLKINLEKSSSIQNILNYKLRINPSNQMVQAVVCRLMSMQHRQMLPIRVASLPG